jgi:hypothetical protein
MDGISAIAPLIGLGTSGAGFIGNLLGQQKQNAYLQQQTAYQQYLQSLAKNPAQLSAMVNAATQPLSGALIQSVNNSVQGNLASRGLSQAPGIFASTEEQALAPYLLQQQQEAQQQVLSSLGLGQGQQPGAQFPQSQNMSFALQQALQALGNRGGGQTQQLPSQLSLPPQLQPQPGLAYSMPDVSAGTGAPPSFTGDESTPYYGGYGS